MEVSLFYFRTRVSPGPPVRKFWGMGRCKADEDRGTLEGNGRPRGCHKLAVVACAKRYLLALLSREWLGRRHCQPRTKHLCQITGLCVPSFLAPLSPRFRGRMLFFHLSGLFPCGEGGWVGGGGGGHYSVPICYRHQQSAEGFGPVRAVGAPLGGTVFKKFAAASGQRFLACFCDVTTTSSAASTCFSNIIFVFLGERFFGPTAFSRHPERKC